MNRMKEQNHEDRGIHQKSFFFHNLPAIRNMEKFFELKEKTCCYWADACSGLPVLID